MKNKNSNSAGSTGKQARDIYASDAERRRAAYRTRQKGWRAALECGLVPDKYAQDIDLELGDDLLWQSEKKSIALKRVKNDIALQIDYESKKLAEREAQVHADFREREQSAKEEMNRAIENAKVKYDNTVKALTESKRKQVDQIKAQRAKIDEIGKLKDQAQVELNTVHDKLGVHSCELDGLILASFPGKDNEALRSAIEKGDQQIIYNWSSG